MGREVGMRGVKDKARVEGKYSCMDSTQHAQKHPLPSHAGSSDDNSCELCSTLRSHAIAFTASCDRKRGPPPKESLESQQHDLDLTSCGPQVFFINQLEK